VVLRVRQIVLDAADVDSVADFWCRLLGWEISHRSADWISLRGDRIGLAVQRAPRHRRPEWPDGSGSQQVHFDIPVADIEVAERLVLELGGSKLAERPSDDPPFRIYADPAGHPFCLEYGDNAA
jgi:hypothetical protein